MKIILIYTAVLFFPYFFKVIISFLTADAIGDILHACEILHIERIKTGGQGSEDEVSQGLQNNTKQPHLT